MVVRVLFKCHIAVGAPGGIDAGAVCYVGMTADFSAFCAHAVLPAVITSGLLSYVYIIKQAAFCTDVHAVFIIVPHVLALTARIAAAEVRVIL